MTDSPVYYSWPQRSVLRVEGGDARHFLQGLITNDITKATNSHVIYAAMLTPQGKYLHDFFVIAQEDNLLLETAASHADSLLKRLTMYKLRAKVTLAKTELAVLGADNLPALSLPEEDGGALPLPDFEAVAFRDPRNASLGLRILLPEQQKKAFIEHYQLTAGADADYTLQRLRLKIPEADTDLIPEQSLPLEHCMDEAHAIDYDKGCYVGQEVTARTKHRATLHRTLFQVKAEVPLPPTGTPITLNGKPAGELRSVCGTTGLAFLRKDRVAQAGETGESLITGEIPLKIIMS